MITVVQWINIYGSDNHLLVMVWKSLRPHCLKNKKKIALKYCAYKRVIMSMMVFSGFLRELGSLWWYSWLRNCTANWKVVGSILDSVTGIFHWCNPSSCTVALGLTQPLTEMNTRNISLGVRRPVLRADNLTNLMCRLVWYLGASTSWNPQGLYRDCFTFTF